MPLLPDRFDLWIRKARECDNPDRQLDYILGAMVMLPEWHFLNIGTKENPQPARAEIGCVHALLFFSDLSRVEDVMEETGRAGEVPSVISIPAEAALRWCVERRDGLIVNQEVMIPFENLEAYAKEWALREPISASGFWIPNLTSQEEDFWQENGV